ncbi:uncharacterized protein METZ01_LOCUS97836 [marine metagenome]|uniref:Uncharacterized protein n=1 Tax=marine metagenome TaxID=408172 RepID=A0A381VXP2_9ZZZZ
MESEYIIHLIHTLISIHLNNENPYPRSEFMKFQF